MLRAPFSSRLCLSELGLITCFWERFRQIALSYVLINAVKVVVESIFPYDKFSQVRKTALAFYSKAETQSKGHNVDKFWARLEWVYSRTKWTNCAADVAMRWRFLQVEEYVTVITYIAGYVCFAINKRLKCVSCKRRMICDTADIQYTEASFHGVVFYFHHWKWFALL